MTDREIEVETKLLKNERQTFNKLKQAYAQALADIKKQVKELQKHSEMPSKIYQIKYQQALEQQTNDILDILNKSNISTVDAFLMLMYEDGYAGIMYSLQGQNIPLVIPIDQNLMIKSISRETDSVKLSSRLYNNVEELKKTVIAEISRGIAGNQDYRDIAVVLSDKGNTSFKRAYTIARTEGHRVAIEAKSDAINKSIENGADLVKMWDATLDGKTRQSHASLDHKWVENDESFTTVDDITGQEVSAPFPGAFGIAHMDINCRCVLLARPRWAVENEQSYEKWDNENHRYITLSRKAGFEKWHEKYVASSNSKYYNNVESLRCPITDKSILSLKNVKINGLNENQCQIAFEQRKRLLERIKNEDVGVEGSVSFTLDGIDFSPVSCGSDGATKIYKSIKPYYAIHNHPDNGVLSPKDLKVFLNKDLNNNCMIGLESLGNNGTSISSIFRTHSSNSFEYAKYIDNELSKFYTDNPDYKMYSVAKLNELSKKILLKGTEYGFKITII